MITKCCDLTVKMSSSISVTGTFRQFGKFPKFQNSAFGVEIIFWVGTQRVNRKYWLYSFNFDILPYHYQNTHSFWKLLHFNGKFFQRKNVIWKLIMWNDKHMLVWESKKCLECLKCYWLPGSPPPPVVEINISIYARW